MIFKVAHINCPHLPQDGRNDDKGYFKTVVTESGPERWVNIELECDLCGDRIVLDLDTPEEDRL